MKTFTRRQFLSNAAVATSALAAFPSIGFSQASSPAGDIRIGIVGVGGKGADHINTFKKLPGVRIVALCDADENVLNGQCQKLRKENIEVTGVVDMRKLLDRKDIDAVVTATPNHWHSLFTVWACQAGKDVYVEKPVSHEIWEGRKMVEAARKYKRIVQPGTQSRSDPALHEAFEYLQKGNLGKIKIIRGFCYKRRASIGKVRGAQPLPAKLDYNLWCGPAPMDLLMRKNLHYDWHWVWPTGNGDIGNQGIHEMDMCRWVSGQKTLPPQILTIGGRFGYEDDATTPNTQIAIFAYDPVPIIFEVRGLPMGKAEGDEGEAMDNYKGARIGLVVECENGYFSGGGGGGSAFDNEGKRIKQFKGPGGKDHQLNFIQAVRSRKPEELNGNIEECHISSAMCHMANISYRLGQKSPVSEIKEKLSSCQFCTETFTRFENHLKANEVDLQKTQAVLGPALKMDAGTERFTGDWSREANLLIKREYREPFVIRDQV